MNEHTSPLAANAARLALAATSKPSAEARFVLARAYWPAAALFAVAIALQVYFGTSTDVSWLITACEKILAGQKPYVDFMEVNPPASILLYLPATWAARTIGVSPEFMVALSGFLAIIASIGLCALILSGAGLAKRIGPPDFAVLLLALLPGPAFDQREHIAVIAGLPLLAVIAARIAGANVATILCVLAGLGGGVMASIKPHFALMILTASSYLGYRLGRRALFGSLELYVAASLVALYAAVVLLFFPAYIDKAAPLVAAVYLPQRESLLALLFKPGLLCWLALGRYLVLIGRGRLGDPLIAIPALASVGAIGAFLLQGKGWPYHAYPAVALMALAFAPLRAELLQGPWRGRLATPKIACAAVLVAAFIHFCQVTRIDNPALERLVSSVAPHPKILVIGPDIALGHPLTRNVGGEWAETFPYLWITDTINFWKHSGKLDAAAAAKYEPYLRYDRETLVADIQRNKPDVILIAEDLWKGWAFAHADVAAALADYQPFGVVGEVTVYGRKLGLRGVNSDSDPP